MGVASYFFRFLFRQTFLRVSELHSNQFLGFFSNIFNSRGSKTLFIYNVESLGGKQEPIPGFSPVFGPLFFFLISCLCCSDCFCVFFRIQHNCLFFPRLNNWPFVLVQPSVSPRPSSLNICLVRVRQWVLLIVRGLSLSHSLSVSLHLSSLLLLGNAGIQGMLLLLPVFYLRCQGNTSYFWDWERVHWCKTLSSETDLPSAQANPAAPVSHFVCF